MIDGFVETGKDIPSGPLEATGKGLGGETIGKTLDAGIGLITFSPAESVKTINKLVPTSAKEAKNMTTTTKVNGIIGTTYSEKTVRSNYVEIKEIIKNDEEDENEVK